MLDRWDAREPFYVSVWSGCDLGAQSLCCFLCFCISLFWPGMVLNQGQRSIVVSDWEPYLDTLFPTCVCGRLTFLKAHSLKCHGLFLYCLLFCRQHLLLKVCTLTTLHLGPVLPSAVTNGIEIEWNGNRMEWK